MILNQLTSIPTTLRLSLCLLVSAGIHGGVTYYDWASQPAAVHDGPSAVVVVRVPTADGPTFAVVDTPEALTKQDPAIAEQKVMAKTAPGNSPAAVVKPPLMTPPKPRPVKESVEVVEKLAEEAEEDVSTCLVCVEPRDEVALMTSPVEMTHWDGVADVAVQEVHVAQNADSQASDHNVAGTTGESLIEAMPNYRNNPLPDYPYIARQRHWQGVVWLLVDVSSKGLVDDVDLQSSSGYRVLDRAASRAVKRWEFTPATRAGLPVDSQVRIPVRFSLEDS
jgi:protein TonB